MKIENEIISSVIAAVKELYGQDIPEKMVALQKTKSNFEGNLTLVVFPFLRMSKKKQNSPPLPDAMYLSPNCLPNWECDLSHFVCCIVMSLKKE